MNDNFVNKNAMTQPASRRLRWLTKEEVTRLLNALPPHQRQLARLAPSEDEIVAQCLEARRN